MSARFFSFGGLRQPVNSWLCIALISLLCFWTVLYYLTHKAEAIGESYATSASVLGGVTY